MLMIDKWRVKANLGLRSSQCGICGGQPGVSMSEIWTVRVLLLFPTVVATLVATLLLAGVSPFLTDILWERNRILDGLVLLFYAALLGGLAAVSFLMRPIPAKPGRCASDDEARNKRNQSGMTVIAKLRLAADDFYLQTPCGFCGERSGRCWSRWPFWSVRTCLVLATVAFVFVAVYAFTDGYEVKLDLTFCTLGQAASNILIGVVACVSSLVSAHLALLAFLARPNYQTKVKP